MEVIAFVGPSGSGKSHRAIGVAHQYNCQGIIDDGLLIEGAKILAGTSAKSEQNRVQAVKRAISMTTPTRRKSGRPWPAPESGGC